MSQRLASLVVGGIGGAGVTSQQARIAQAGIDALSK